MTKRMVRLPRDGRPLLDIFSAGRGGRPFSRAQIEQIARTVGRTPEVMVKVTGGGAKIGAVGAHFNYISRKGEREIETDNGERLGKEDQKAFIASWHLDLSAGQYRRAGDREHGRNARLVHNIVLSMPAPTPPNKVLAAARAFAREQFALKHRYAMVLHTDQKHPHVHLVVKAESEQGRHLSIDKAMLREWRADFARMMREQGIAANATPRVMRGENKRKPREAILRAHKHGDSRAFRERAFSVATELARSGTIRDPARSKLIETRKAVVESWLGIAERLDAQGEPVLAGDVRYFARHLPPVLTDREKLAVRFVEYLRRSTTQTLTESRDRTADLARNL